VRNVPLSPSLLHGESRRGVCPHAERHARTHYSKCTLERLRACPNMQSACAARTPTKVHYKNRCLFVLSQGTISVRPTRRFHLKLQVLPRRPRWRRGRSIGRRRRSGAEGSAGVTKSKARVRLLSCPQQASRSHHQRSHSVRFHASSLITSECQLRLQGGQHPSHVTHPFPKSACRQPWSERCSRCASIGPPRCSDAAGRAV
jgi:hypothetical protein